MSGGGWRLSLISSQWFNQSCLHTKASIKTQDTKVWVSLRVSNSLCTVTHWCARRKMCQEEDVSWFQRGRTPEAAHLRASRPYPLCPFFWLVLFCILFATVKLWGSSRNPHIYFTASWLEMRMILGTPKPEAGIWSESCLVEDYALNLWSVT